MAILKCKMCGGDIELSADKTFGTCEFCGSTMTFPKVDDEQRAAAFNRGNHFRRLGEFDKALAVYERIVQEDESDAEAHWCCALCRFGIEYVEDPNTFEYLPTCHRASFDSFLEDVDYLAALEHSDGITRRQYQKDAAKIAEVQRGILATSQNEEPFDVFICYKESEDDGRRTRDSLYAQDIYYQLTEQGRRVFFSRITLEDKAGTEYEPYIFAALNSAKVMILVTTSAEHANAVWVKNEWSRFLSLMRKDRTKLLLPCYRDMDPYDLPEALSVLQSYDMSKIGFIQDLIRGVNKVLEGAKPKQAAKETVIVQQQSGHAAPLLERAFMFLEDGDWAKADEFCEQVLNLEPKNALAYLGKLMAELKVRKREALKDCAAPFDNRNSYQKAIRFGDDKLKNELTGTNDSIKARIAEENRRAEEARKEGIYQNGLLWMKEQNYKSAKGFFDSIPDYKDAAEQSRLCVERTETVRQESIYQKADGLMKAEKFSEAKNLFDSIPSYKDAAEQSKACIEQEEAVRKNNIYAQAVALMKKDAEEELAKAAQLFVTIPGWKDADQQVATCEARIKELKAQMEVEAARKNSVYTQAEMYMVKNTEAGYAQAAELFDTLGNWKNADRRAVACRAHIDRIKAQDKAKRIECQRKAEYERMAAEKEAHRRKKRNTITAIILILVLCATGFLVWTKVIQPNQQYNTALALYESGRYEDAIAAFEALNGYKDSSAQINACQTVINDRNYDAALALYNGGKFEEAIAAFSSLNSYKDSDAKIEACQTAIKDKDYAAAEKLLDAGKYDAAISAFINLNGYRDSEERVLEAKYAIGELLLNDGQFEKAEEAFEEIKDYSDSADKIDTAKEGIRRKQYNNAVSLKEKGKYDEAINAFTELGDYLDSKAQIQNCKNAITENTYQQAVKKLESGAYDDAYAIFTTITKYKDVSDLLASNQYLQKAAYRKQFEPGKSIKLGKYEQDNNTKNGAETIEWIVLKREKDKALIASRYVLDVMQFHNVRLSGSNISLTWDNCSLRKWLNGSFYNDVFNTQEMQYILTTSITTEDSYYGIDGGNDTKDKIFLLSVSEAKALFESNDARICEPTAYASSKEKPVSGHKGVWWWLRTPGDKDHFIAMVEHDGSLYSKGGIAYDTSVHGDDVGSGVRPALWIDIGY